MYFRCSQCRKKIAKLWFERPLASISPVGTRSFVDLTGKKRALNDGRASIRNSTHTRQYRCVACKHVGWSRHIELQWLEERQKEATV